MRLICSAVVFFVLLSSGCDKTQRATTSNQPDSKGNSNAPARTTSEAASADDRVEGTLTVNGNPVSLKHVYAWTTKGAFDETKTDVRVLITDQPVPEEKLRSLMPIMSGDSTQGIALRIDEDKKIIGGEVYHSALKHGYFSGSGMYVFEPVSFDTNLVEAKASSGGPQETFGDKWEYSVSFRVKVRRL
jgi:hypothetical protein